MRKLGTIILLSCLSIAMWAQSKNAAYEAYIAEYRQVAIEQQRKHGIPASITMAQAILESAAGTSELATKANNHFGIKCTSDWPGKTYKHSDNRSGECFRKYADVADSYEDHSLFLKRKRYESLYALSVGDYKNWAYGLKTCGYATDPKYPEKLIRIIELYELNKLTFDKSLVKSGAVSKKKLFIEEEGAEIAFAEQEQVEDYAMPPMEELQLFHNHRSGYRNGVRYVIAGPNETFASLALFLNMYERTLRKYNDALDTRELKEGDIVYIYPKKNKANRRYPTYYFKTGDDAWEIAQKYGIKLKSLYKLNGIPYGTPLTTHQRLDLR
jgi:LysM repeat protein